MKKLKTLKSLLTHVRGKVSRAPTGTRELEKRIRQLLVLKYKVDQIEKSLFNHRVGNYGNL